MEKLKLYKLNYKENFGNKDKNYWEIKDLIFGNQNLIIGKNATGKSRTMNVINGFAKIIMGKTLTDGNIQAEFLNGESRYFVELSIEKGIVKKEEIKVNNEIRLKRNNSEAEIYFENKKKLVEINPPENELVLRRRDTKEHSFLELLFDWASNVRGYQFGDTDPRKILIPEKNMDRLISLDTVPTVLAEMKKESINQIVKDFNAIGYNIENAVSEEVQENGFNIKMIKIKEKKLKFDTKQMELSQGMFRAFALLVIIQSILDEKDNENTTTILVDDLCEGLDYERSMKFSKLLFKKLKNKNIQFIATTNDEYTADSIDLENINVLKREWNIVKSYNYGNSKEIFDEFSFTGLSNFDFFASDFLDRKIIKK